MQDTCLSSSSTFGPHWNSYILQVDRERERERAPSHILYKHVCTGIAHSAYTLSELYLRSQKTQGKTSPTPCKRHPPLVDFLGKIWVKKLSEHWASLYRQLALHSFHWCSNRSWVHSWKHRPFSNARKKRKLSYSHLEVRAFWGFLGARIRVNEGMAKRHNSNLREKCFNFCLGTEKIPMVGGLMVFGDQLLRTNIQGKGIPIASRREGQEAWKADDKTMKWIHS